MRVWVSSPYLCVSVVRENGRANRGIEETEPLLHQPILHRTVIRKQLRQPLIARVERALPCLEQDAGGNSRLVP